MPLYPRAGQLQLHMQCSLWVQSMLLICLAKATKTFLDACKGLRHMMHISACSHADTSAGEWIWLHHLVSFCCSSAGAAKLHEVTWKTNTNYKSSTICLGDSVQFKWSTAQDLWFSKSTASKCYGSIDNANSMLTNSSRSGRIGHIPTISCKGMPAT